MSKYLGPFWKKQRVLWGKGKRWKTNPPGIHGGKKRRRLSTYGSQLREKQKVMYSYGWRDKQLKNEYIKAKSKAGSVGTNFLIGSNSRLDNLVFQSGLLNTIGFAREWVSHGHFLVNGKKVKVPSYKVKIGQTISLRKEKMVENKLIKDNLEKNIKTPSYVNFDRQKLTISYLRYPVAEELNKGIDASLIAEWYNRKV